MGFSFEHVNATDYDELRSTYAPESVRWVAERARLEPGSLVVDLAAGTGQLSRRFASLGVAGARRRTRRQHARGPRDEPARGARRPRDRGRDPAAATARPHAVVVGNAFHHFDAGARSPRSGACSVPVARSRCSGRGRTGTPMACGWASARSTRSSNANAGPHRSSRRTAPGTSRPSMSRDSRRSNGVRSRPHDRWPRRGSRICYATSSDIASLPEPQRSRLLARIGELAAELPRDARALGAERRAPVVRDGSGTASPTRPGIRRASPRSSVPS